MNNKIKFLLLLILLVSSCVVKSLQPFYLLEHISFDQELIGEWKDQNNNEWIIFSFKEEWKKSNIEKPQTSEESQKAYDKYQDAYIVQHNSEGRKAEFIAMPFKVDDHLFIDFTPYEYQSDKINPLAAQHILNTHSTAFIKKNKKGYLEIKWLSDEVIDRFFDEGKLKLAHEKIGVEEELVLTANSKELYEFLRKFMKADIKDKWEKEDSYTLIRTNG